MLFTTQISGIPPCIVPGCELDTFASLLPESYFENEINFELFEVNTLAVWSGYKHIAVSLYFLLI